MTVTVRDLRERDRAAIARIDARHTGAPKKEYWAEVLSRFVRPAAREAGCVGLAADSRGELVGYLLGEVRAFEFGSEACGWVFAVGVDADRVREGIAGALLRESVARFRALGISKVRTMVRRNDVPVLSFFRSAGFVGGGFVQLELDLEEAR